MISDVYHGCIRKAASEKSAAVMVRRDRTRSLEYEEQGRAEGEWQARSWWARLTRMRLDAGAVTHLGEQR